MKCSNPAGFVTQLWLYSVRHSAASVPHHPTELAEKSNIHQKSRAEQRAKKKKQKCNLARAPYPAERQFSAFSQGLPVVFFTLAVFLHPVWVAACPRCVSKWSRGSVFVCAPCVYKSHGSTSQQSTESSRKRPLLFYSRAMSARVRQ